MFFSRKKPQKPAVVELNLAFKNIELIPLDLGEKFASLTHLDLSNNAISDPSSLIDLGLLETLVLDHNRLTSASRIPSLPKLTFLSVNNNKIANLTSFVDRLALATPRLSYFSMLQNPACPNFLNGGSKAQYEDYRRYVICRLKHLKNLDGHQVVDEERQAAEALYGSVGSVAAHLLKSGNLTASTPTPTPPVASSSSTPAPTVPAAASPSSASLPSPPSSSSSAASSTSSTPSSVSSSPSLPPPPSPSTSSSSASTSSTPSSSSSSSATARASQSSPAAAPTSLKDRAKPSATRAKQTTKPSATATTRTAKTTAATKTKRNDLLPNLDPRSDGAKHSSPPPPPPPSSSQPTVRTNKAASSVARGFVDLPSPDFRQLPSEENPPPPPPIAGDALISDEDSWTESVEEEEDEADRDVHYASDVGRLPNVQYQSNRYDEDEDEEESWTESEELPPVAQADLPEPPLLFLPSLEAPAAAAAVPASMTKFFMPKQQSESSESSDWSD